VRHVKDALGDTSGYFFRDRKSFGKSRFEHQLECRQRIWSSQCRADWSRAGDDRSHRGLHGTIVIGHWSRIGLHAIRHCGRTESQAIGLVIRTRLGSVNGRSAPAESAIKTATTEATTTENSAAAITGIAAAAKRNR
jgi:hypothetical protein